MKSVNTAIQKESKYVTKQEAIENLGDVNRRYDEVEDLLCKMVDYFNDHPNLSKKEALILEYGITNVFQSCEEALNLLNNVRTE
jgi:hypothetical protein